MMDQPQTILDPLNERKPLLIKAVGEKMEGERERERENEGREGKKEKQRNYKLKLCVM